MDNFKDNFSKHSDIYLKYRPHYPVGLFSYLSSLTAQHDLAWDCGTGNGQAAIALTGFYDIVVATDPSGQQINNAIPHHKVCYKVEKAEHSSIPSHTADLLTIANALHWFDFDLFYKEANRVLKPGGIIAAWCYEVPTISPAINPILRHYHDHTLNNYWQPENRLVEKGYATLTFPYDIIDAPIFYCEKDMCLDDLIGYLNTWSATQRHIAATGTNPTNELKVMLEKVWGDAKTIKNVSWRLFLKVGRTSY